MPDVRRTTPTPPPPPPTDDGDALVLAATRWGGFAAVMWRDPADGLWLGRAATSPNVMPVAARVMVEEFIRRTGLVKMEGDDE